MTAQELEGVWTEVNEKLNGFATEDIKGMKETDGCQTVYVEGAFRDDDVLFLIVLDDSKQIAGFYIEDM